MMDTDIYVFSGTGNSLAIAEQVAKQLNDVKIIYIPNILNPSDEKEIKIKAEKNWSCFS